MNAAGYGCKHIHAHTYTQTQKKNKKKKRFIMSFKVVSIFDMWSKVDQKYSLAQSPN